MSITTDYTVEENKTGLKNGVLSGYRTMYWLCDILKNFMSDPINIKDERLSKVLYMQNKEGHLDALFDVSVGYYDNTQKANTTPMIIISLGATQYPVKVVNSVGADQSSLCGSIPMRAGVKHKAIALKVTVITETYPGTILLTELIENFMLINELNFKADNPSISGITVTGVSAPVMTPPGQKSNAKCVYTSEIGLLVVGGLSWTTDTQGPVFRGVSIGTTFN